METMRAWVLTEPRKMEIRALPMHDVKEGEVLVRIKSMGICGSDLHFYTDGKIGDYAMNGKPLILGHECAGEGVTAGEGCSRLSVGDRVIVEPGKPCMRCDECRAGRYNFCHNMYFMGTPPWDGCMCEYVAWPEFLVYEMPEDMSYQEGALIEPFTVGLQGVTNSGIGYADSAVVVGCGTIGMMTIHALKTIGAGTIIAVDMEPFKLEMAKKMGATDTINPRDGDVAEKIRELTDGYGARYAFESVGTEKTFYDISGYVRDGATITLLGLLIDDGTPMPMSSAVMRGLTYKTVIRYVNQFEKAMTLIHYGRANILPVMTHQFPFEKAQEAFDKAVAGKKDSIKVVVDF